MNDPRNTFDPAAARALERIINTRHVESQQDNEYSPIDSIGLTPNSTAMSDLSRQELKAELAASEAKVDARLANFDTTVKTGFADLRAEFAGLRADMAKMRGETEKQSHDSTKWIVGSVFGMLSLSVAILAAIINFTKGDRSPAAAQVQPAPIVITVPSPPATSPPSAK